MSKIEAYDSAYPGSMHQREDGSYIRREDAESLAAALLALVYSGDDAAQDWKEDAIRLESQLTEAQARVKELEAENKSLFEACQKVEPLANKAMTACAEAAEKDAARYRFIRKGQGYYGFEVIKRGAMFQDKWLTGKKLDAAIDAAIKQEQGE